MLSFLQISSFPKRYSLPIWNSVDKTLFLTHTCLKGEDRLMTKFVKNLNENKMTCFKILLIKRKIS